MPGDDQHSHNNLMGLWSVPLLMRQLQSSFGAEGIAVTENTAYKQQSRRATS